MVKNINKIHKKVNLELANKKWNQIKYENNYAVRIKFLKI